MECIVTEPPVSGGVENRVEQSMNPRRRIDVIVRSTAEVPRDELREVSFELRQVTYQEDHKIYSGEVINPITLAASGIINIRTNSDPREPATATLVTD